MKKLFFLLVFSSVLVITMPETTFAQCPMCKANVMAARKNNQPVGNGLNMGILYLLAAPYLGVAAVGYWWWKSQRQVRS